MLGIVRRWLGLFLCVLVMTAQRFPKPPLVEAAEAGDVARVAELLDSGAEPNEPRSFSALQTAAACAFPEIVREMLKHRPAVNQRDNAGRTALQVIGQSAVGDKREDAAEVVRLLAAAGAEIDVQDNFYGNSALHEALNAGMAKALISAGANINLKNKDGQTPLMLTLDEEIARALLDAGADASLKDNRGKTALDIAREFELTEKIAVLTAKR
jgi:ankyrin repeat protein